MADVRVNDTGRKTQNTRFAAHMSFQQCAWLLFSTSKYFYHQLSTQTLISFNATTLHGPEASTCSLSSISISSLHLISCYNDPQ